jgi:hypothetical protein
MATTSTTSGLSTWAGPYVERLLQQGEAFAGLPYVPYDKPLSAGFTTPQTEAITGLGSLASPQSASFYTQYINPYQQNVIDVAKREATRTSNIAGQTDAARAVGAGAFGGSRYAIQQAERDRNLQRQLGDIQMQGSQAAYQNAQQYGLQALGADVNRLSQMYGIGAQKQATEQAAIDRDRAAFEMEQYKYPQQMLEFRKNLISGFPMATQSYYEQGPSNMQNLSSAASILAMLKYAGILK